MPTHLTGVTKSTEESADIDTDTAYLLTYPSTGPCRSKVVYRGSSRSGTDRLSPIIAESHSLFFLLVTRRFIISGHSKWHPNYYLSACHPLIDCFISSDANSIPPPIELIDKCVGSRIWVVMKGDKGNNNCHPSLNPTPMRLC